MPSVLRGGEIVEIAPEQLAQAADEGWSPISDQEVQRLTALKAASGGAQQALAGVEGVARGATIGLSDAAIGELLGPEYSKQAGLRREANPMTSIGGEVVGTIAPAVVSGGESLLAKAASAPLRGITAAAEGAGAVAKGVVGSSAKSLTGKILQKGAEVATRGAVEGAAFGVGNKVSEAYLGDHELNAEQLLAGLEEGAIFGGLAGGAFGATQAVGGKLTDMLIGGSGALRPQLEEWSNKLATKSLGGKAADYRSLGTLEQQQQMEQRIGKRLFKENIISATSSKEEMGELIGKKVQESGKNIGKLVDELDAKASTRLDTDAFIARARREVLEPLQEFASLKTEAAWLEGHLDDLAENLQKDNSFKNGWRQKKGLGDKIYNEKTGMMRGNAKYLDQVRGILNDELSEVALKAAEEGGESLSSRWGLENQRYAELKTAERFSRRAIGREAGNRTIGLGEMLGGLGGLAVADPTMGLAAGGIAHMVKHYGDQAMAKALREIPSLLRLEQETAKVSSSIDTAIKAALPDTPKTFVDNGLKLSTRPANDVIPLVEQIQNLKTNPSEIQNASMRITGQFAQHAPMAAAAVGMVLLNRANFLFGKLPPTGKRETLTPQLDKPRYSPEALHKFDRYYQATMNPLGVLKSFQQGAVSREAVEALKATSPKIYAKLQEAAMQRISNRGVKLSYFEKTQLSTLLGIPADGTLTPEFRAKMQASKAPNDEQPQAGRRRASAKSDVSIYDAPSHKLSKV
jgi:hypothetical protein